MAIHESSTEYRAGSVHEASLISNSAVVRGGGAIAVHGGVEFSMMNSTCMNNVAAVGAVYAHDDVRLSVVSHTFFKDNWAIRAGGSITVYVSRKRALNLVICLSVFRMEEE